ncbi:MAG TPA: hypothetical protein VFK45_09125, partial [Gammaproteobacteria bacterium]|nr:hypothetical protein [Gammaproteobacteria bacterium]
LTAPAGAAQFGAAVTIADGVILVGAPDTEASGAVYVYVQDQDGFARSAVLHAASADGAAFGASVAMDGGRAIIGAPGIGNAYIYYGVLEGGAPKPVRTFSGLEEHFGSSVAIDGDVAAAGALGSKRRQREGSAHYTGGSGFAFVIETEIDLSLDVQPDHVSARVGSQFTVNAMVVNHDPTLTAHHVTLLPLNPVGVDVLSSSVDCDGEYVLDCDLGTLGPGLSREASFTFKIRSVPRSPFAGDSDTDILVEAFEADQNGSNESGATDVRIIAESPDSTGGGGALGSLWLLYLSWACFLRRRN